MIIFNERLKLLRKSKSLSQKQLGEIFGLAERSVQNYELGERTPSLEILCAFADYFEVSLDYLVGRTDN